jgi:DNA-binding SARP family transcriptional activator
MMVYNEYVGRRLACVPRGGLALSRLSIHLFGSLRVILNGEAVTGFESQKARALLAYLAVEADRAHPREKLAGMLWPEWSDQVART